MFISFAADYWHWTVRTVIWKKFIRLYQEPIEILNFHWIEGNWNFLRDSIWDIGMELTATIKQVVIDIISYHNFLTMKISISTISSNLYRWFILIIIENITTKKTNSTYRQLFKEPLGSSYKICHKIFFVGRSVVLQYEED